MSVPGGRVRPLSRRELIATAAWAPLAAAVDLSAQHSGGEKLHYDCPRQLHRAWTFSDGVVGRTVITTGSGPDVIVLHEINGACDEFFAFVDCLAAKGFTVHAPVLFGTPYGRASTLRQMKYWLKACAGPDLACFSHSDSNRLDAWLVALCGDLVKHTRKPLGAIGMCLTGIQPLAMLRSCSVVAPVLCQPTVPIGVSDAIKADLGLGASAIAHAVARVADEGLGVLLIRYPSDQKCPEERVKRLRQLFGKRLTDVDIPGDGHSSLVHDPTRKAFDAVVEFLNGRLRREAKCHVR